MSQPTQPAYGRPAYNYNAGPSYGAGGGGYPPPSQSVPPQSDPQAFYSPNLQQETPAGYPPQSNPQPFYMLPPQPQQQPSGQPHPQQPPSTAGTIPKPLSADPYAPQQQRISSTTRPQSLAQPTGTSHCRLRLPCRQHPPRIHSTSATARATATIRSLPAAAATTPTTASADPTAIATAALSTAPTAAAIISPPIDV